MIETPLEGTRFWVYLVGHSILGLTIIFLLLSGIRKLFRHPYPRKRKHRKGKGKTYSTAWYWSYYVKNLKSKPYFIFFDTETSGLPKDFKAKAAADDNWPRLVQIAWIVTDTNLNTVSDECHLIKPVGFEIPDAAQKVNGITTEYARENGENLTDVLEAFRNASKSCCVCIGHNIRFDQMVVGSEFLRAGMKDVISGMTGIDTMESSKNFCNLHKPDGTLKRPKLQELYTILFGEEFKDAHDAMADVTATKACFEELLLQDVIRIAGYNYQIDND